MMMRDKILMSNVQVHGFIGFLKGSLNIFLLLVYGTSLLMS